MNLASCTGCGNVIDLKRVKYIPMELPDNPDDEKFRDKDGSFDIEIECHYNPNLIWEDTPLDTWECVICGEFNGKKE